MRRKKHKYPLGELVIYKQENNNVAGIISKYDGRYYLVEWFGDVPQAYKGILAEVEIAVLKENTKNI